MKKTKEEIVEYINNLAGYQGYIQYSNRPIDKKTDIFIKDDPKVELNGGFIYEAHFCNGNQSISIKQLNDSWYIDETDILNIPSSDIENFITDIENFPKVKMAQIWEKKKDELCEDMEVMKLKKVVFVGFEGVSNQPIETKKEKYTKEQKEILLNHFLKIFKDEYIMNILENINAKK